MMEKKPSISEQKKEILQEIEKLSSGLCPVQYIPSDD